jgi:signal transduction histidine kinase/HAMP domain-containing protein
MVRRLFVPGLLRDILRRTIIVSVGPLLVLVAAALYFSNSVLFLEFEDEARLLATSAATGIDSRVQLLTRSASLIAGLPTTRELTEAADRDQISAFLLPLRTRLRVDIMNVANARGEVIATAQEEETSPAIKPELMRRALASVDQSWVLFDEPAGLTVRAIAPIRAQGRDPVGFLEIGAVLDPNFLQSIKGSTDTEVALVWDAGVRASTIPLPDASSFPVIEDIEAAQGDTVTRAVELGGVRYYGVFSVVRSHAPRSGVLAVLVPVAPIEAAQRSLLGTLFLVAAILLPAIVLLAYRSAATLTSPLVRLVQAAQRIESGDLSVRVPERSAHEIGRLEHAFDTMAHSLQERERLQQAYLAEARTTNAVADAVVGVTDRDRIFAESLGRIASLLNADGAAIVLREDAPGAPPYTGGRLTTAAAIEIDAAAALTFAARFLVSGKTELNVVHRIPVTGSDLAVGVHIPLSARGRAIGVLSAYFADEREVTDSEARALRTVARLVSVAKENADLVTELRENNIQLERANRLKSEFLASVSHELRTPMNAIIGYTRIMLDGLDGEISEQQELDLKRVAQAADNLLALINDLLDLAKIEAGRMEINLEDIHLPALVNEVLELGRPNAKSKGIELRSEVPTDLSPVWADRARTRQILVNLLANAVKFTDRGAVTVHASESDGWATISVSDTGIGISPEALTYIFDEFRQADSSTTRKYGGTGLGLAISRRLVDLQGGRIWVESEVGKGSVFRFTLPVRSSAVDFAKAGMAAASA